MSQGKGEEAEALYRRAITILREILGDDHMAVAEMSTKLAVLLESHGDQEEAGLLYVDALEVKERVRNSGWGHTLLELYQNIVHCPSLSVQMTASRHVLHMFTQGHDLVYFSAVWVDFPLYSSEAASGCAVNLWLHCTALLLTSYVPLPS